MSKKLVRIFASVLLILCTLTLFTLESNEGVLTQGTISKNEMFVSEDGTITLLTPLDKTFNGVLIKFSEDLPKDAIVKLHYLAKDPASNSNKFIEISNHKNIVNERTVFFSFPISSTDTNTQIRITTGSEYSPEEVNFYETRASDLHLTFNFISFGILLVLLGLLFLFEKKIEFYKSISDTCKKKFAFLVELKRNNKLRFALHLSAFISLCTLVLTVATLIIFAIYSKHTIITVYILAAVTVALQLIDRFLLNKNSSPAKLFLIIAVVLGIMMCYTSPVSTRFSWDDEIHFVKVLEAVDIGEDASLLEWRIFTQKHSISEYIKSPDVFISSVVAESKFPVTYNFDAKNIFTMISYAPMLIATLFSNLIQADIVKIFVLCKFANMLSYTAIIYFGLKKLKYGQNVVAAICLLPCTLFLSCSYGYDAWLTAWIAYGFMYVISILQDSEKTFSVSDMVKILLAFFVGCNAKLIYCAMMLPLLFIKKSKFSKPEYAKRFRICTVLVMFVIAMILILPGIFMFNFYSDARGGSNVDTMGQILHILKHPLAFLKTLIIHLVQYCSISNFSSYGSVFGYLEGYFGHPIAFGGTIATLILVYSILSEHTYEVSETLEVKKIRPFVIFTCIAQVILICLSMYLAFNDVGATVINGVQFRYLFPVMIPFFMMLLPKNIVYRGSVRVRDSIVYGGSALNLVVGYFYTYIVKFLH